MRDESGEFLRSSVSLLLLLLLLLPTSAIAQSIVDTGDVVVDADNQLIVGQNAPGGRVIDGADDGPYTNIDIAPGLFSSPNSIVVENAGSLTSLGDLSLSVPGTDTFGGFADLMILNESRVETDRLLIGESVFDGGAGSIRIEGGSTLHSSSASIYLFDITSSASVSVVGPDSSWITDGVMTVSSWNPGGISIENGAYGYAGSTNIVFNYSNTTLSVIGPGSVWETGGMNIGSGHGYGVEILDGGLINSGDVLMMTETYQEALIQGEESRWNIDGKLTVFGHPAGGSSLVTVLDGASLWSREATISNGSGFSGVRIGGEGSTWSSGDLTLSSYGSDDTYAVALVSVTGGGLLNSGAVSFSSCSWPGYGGGGDYDRGCAIRVEGNGSRWISDGPVSVAATETGLAAIDITDHALAVIRDKLTIGDNSQLNLDEGVLIAHRTTIADGELRGTGVIGGQVINSGRIAPGDTATGDIGGITIEGNYLQSDGASLDIQLGGTTPSLQHDILIVLGTSVLDGELNITLAEGYLPEHGNTFYVVFALEQLVGEFDFVSGLDLGDGLTLDLLYSDHFVALRAVDANWVAPAVPEPTAALLFGLGLLLVRRRISRCN